jgi:ABC-type sugar transport system ATPase subunit
MIRLENVHLRAGSFSLSGISFEIASREYCVLMGKTGSGKTTILEAVAGLRPITSGRIELLGRDVSQARPAERGIGYVPQDGALFARMTVRNHFAFALKLRHWPRRQISERVQEMAELLGVEDLLRRRPQGLSGGERQRVALGRALSFRPQVLLLDEPLSALDDTTRLQMYDLLKRIQDHEPITILHITHNQHTADHLADRVFCIECGKVECISVGEGDPT